MKTHNQITAVLHNNGHAVAINFTSNALFALKNNNKHNHKTSNNIFSYKGLRFSNDSTRNNNLTHLTSLNQQTSLIQIPDTKRKTQNIGLPASDISFSGAGLSYSYKLEIAYLKFGIPTHSSFGSEHHINNKSFDAELQVLAYNSLFYKNFEEASTKPQGLLAVSILIKSINKTVSDSSLPAKQVTSESLDLIASKFEFIKFRGQQVLLEAFNFSTLLSDKENFVTYEGSLTIPACYESVTWVVLNKPLYIQHSSVSIQIRLL